MKKLRVLLFMMIAVVFSLTGCGSESALKYEVDQQTLIDDAKNTFEYLLNLSDSGKKYTIAQGQEPYADAVSGLITANEEAGAYVSLKETKFTQNKDDIDIVLVCEFEKAEVEASFVYETNDAYDYRDVYQNPDNILPYKASEITIQTVHSKSYYMMQAVSNTLLGMGTVFIMLILISLLISTFKFIPVIVAKFEKKPAKEPAKEEKKAAPAAPVAVSEPDLMNDSELVAVITAAIYAAEGTTGSKDTLVVRSISRARR